MSTEDEEFYNNVIQAYKNEGLPRLIGTFKPVIGDLGRDENGAYFMWEGSKWMGPRRKKDVEYYCKSKNLNMDEIKLSLTEIWQILDSEWLYDLLPGDGQDDYILEQLRWHLMAKAMESK